MVVQVYELITCVRRANENAGNLISGVQFLINVYISVYIYIYIYIYVCVCVCVCIYIDIHIYICYVCIYVCMYLFMYACMYIYLFIYLLKTELRILDFQHFHWLAGHRLSAHIPALPNMVNESINK